MRRRGLFGFLAGAVAAVPAVAGVEPASAPPTPAPAPDPVLPRGTVLHWQGDGPLPPGWAEFEEIVVYQAVDMPHSHGLAAIPCHAHSITQGYAVGMPAQPLRRLVKL